MAEPEEESTDHPPIGSARSAILAEFLRLAAQVGVDNVRIDDVLHAAHSSPSSLYHHFGSRAGLRAVARSERKRLGILEEDQTLLGVPASLTTEDEFLDFIAAQLRRTVTDPAARERRQERLESLTVGLRDPDIRHETRRLLTFLADATRDAIQIAVDRGICNPDLDVEAFVSLLMSLSMGQLATESMMDVERWLAVATPALLAPLRL